MKDCQEDPPVESGAPGFVARGRPRTVTIEAAPAIKDALGTSFAPGSLDVGFLALEPAHPASFARNGRARLADDRIQVTSDEVYANCPQAGTGCSRPGLERRPADGGGAFLSTGTARNVSIYHRCGFRVVEGLDAPAGGRTSGSYGGTRDCRACFRGPLCVHAGRLPLSLSAGRRNAVRIVLWSGSQLASSLSQSRVEGAVPG
jgi:hypothetical protein